MALPRLWCLVMQASLSVRALSRAGIAQPHRSLKRPLAARRVSSQAVANSLYPPERTLPVSDRKHPTQESGSWPHDARWLAGCSAEHAPLRVAVLLSGGVDSSLALALLKAAGHEVHAFYLQIWFQEDFRNFWDSCPWEEDLDYAQKVCDQLGVPLTTVPLTKQYWERVVSHCVEQIHLGRTPNPDVLCNSRVKFGAFFEYLQSHSAQFDRVASGHYACIQAGPLSNDQSSSAALTEESQVGSSRSVHNSISSDHIEPHLYQNKARVQLRLTPDSWKDQTYFLANLSQQQLQQVLFPLGHLTKTKVRELAIIAQLPTMARKDSQGICFLGKVKFSEFIKEHLGEWPGPVIEAESNKVVASHPGFWFYTIGQRAGLDLGHLENGPWYVVRKDSKMNAVYVSLDYFSEDKSRDTFTCGCFNWINGSPPTPVTSPDSQHHTEPYKTRSIECTSTNQNATSEGDVHDDDGEQFEDAISRLFVKVRHGPDMYECKEFKLTEDGSRAHVRLSENDQGLAAGQYAVFYQGGECLGCGVIE